MNPMSGKWGYSNDEEIYSGRFDTVDEAMVEAKALGYRVVGEYREPDAPEYFVDAEMLLDHIVSNDDYDGEWADGWPDATEDQMQELTSGIIKVFGEWLDKHDLRPKWGLVRSETIRHVEN
jgi:hypothetical protein